MNTHRDGEEPQAPPRLVAALKALPPRRVFVPPSVDETVLLAARKQLPASRRTDQGVIGLFRSWRWRLAAAAACLAAGGALYFAANQASTLDTFAREDVNRDGRVDILDAFQLARDLPVAPRTMDLNGDGTVDGRDVDFVANRAVQLGKGGQS